MASRMIRRVLADVARAKGYQKRGGGAQRVTLIESRVHSKQPEHDLIALDDALEALDARKGQVVECCATGSFRRTGCGARSGGVLSRRSEGYNPQPAVTSDRFARIETLYHAARARTPETRALVKLSLCVSPVSPQRPLTPSARRHGINPRCGANP